MTCQKCGRETSVRVNGRCPACDPFRACPVKGCRGTLVSRSIPDWMNCFVCDTCGKKVSR